jgi:serine/threonine-protein kinase
MDDHDEIAEYLSPPRRFAGIAIEEFRWARQRSRRLMAFWVLTVGVLTGLVAIAGWALGTNLDGLLGR